MPLLPRALALVALCLPLWGCPDPDPVPGPFGGSDADVTGPAGEASAEAVEVDVYLDATTSMEGYVGPETEYAEFLRALEASLISKWGEADVRFYKFGTRVDSIGRDGPGGYLSARDDLAFYRQPGVFERTNIDSVLARTDADRVSLVVTDLFQDAGDTNALVGKVKDRVFARGLAAGVLAVESAFDGTVYDAPGGAYRYASTPGDAATYRPFYALAFGAPAQVERLFETLRGTQGVRPDRTTIISPYVVDDFDLDLTKAPGDAARGINVASADDGQYRFVVRDGFEGGVLNGTLELTPSPTAPDVVADRVELVAYRKGPGEADSIRTSDIQMRNVRANGDDLTFDLDVAVEEPPGRYAYLLLVQAGGNAGLAPPAWVRDLSTTDPTAEADPNKTLNLERLVSDLVQASATVQRPLLGRAVISLTKQ